MTATPVLPSVEFSEHADLDSLANVLERLTGLAFDVTLVGGTQVTVELVGVASHVDDDYALDVVEHDSRKPLLLLLSQVAKIVYC